MTSDIKLNRKVFSKSNIFTFGALILITILFRLYKFDSPLVEYHGWRQADTLAVARNFARDGYDLFHPKYDDVSKLQSNIENPQGYRMVEFPIFNAIIGLTFQAVHFLPIEQAGRLVNIVFSAACTVLIFLIVKKIKNHLAAWTAALVFATFPFFVFYTRAVLPETMAITLVLLSTFTALSDSKRFLAKSMIAFIFFGLAVLVKPTAIFFGMVPFMILIQSSPFKKKRLYTLIALSLISLVPFLAWRQYIKAYPEGIPSSEWLLTHINTEKGLESIFFKPAFFRWIFYERLNLLILGSFAFLLPVIGLLSDAKKHVHYLLCIASLIYLFTFQGGNVQHEYYQVLVLPALAILLGIGVSHLVKTQKNIYYSAAAFIAIVVILVTSWIFSYEKVRHYYYSLSDIPEFAKIVKDLTSPDDRIVVDTQGDTTTLFAFDRKGAPAIVGDPPELVRLGYKYLFTFNQETAQNLINAYSLKVVFRNNRFALLKL